MLFNLLVGSEDDSTKVAAAATIYRKINVDAFYL